MPRIEEHMISRVGWYQRHHGRLQAPAVLSPRQHGRQGSCHYQWSAAHLTKSKDSSMRKGKAQ
jgi:hypothetical protein